MKLVKTVLRRQMLPRRRDKRLSGRIVVAGMFSTGNGLARAAVGCFHRLQRAGLDPVAVDISGILNQVDCTPDVPIGPIPEETGQTLLLFINAPETEAVIWQLGLRRWQGWRVIGNWAWELPVPPPGWGQHSRYLSEIWVPSRFVANSLAGVTKVPVRVIPHALALPERPPAAAGASQGEVFHVLAAADARSSIERKNVLGAIRIFKSAFRDVEHVKLTLKCRNLSEFRTELRRVQMEVGDDPRIEILDRTLDSASSRALIEGIDVLLSPHRAEGFGLMLAEAMMLGKAVLATGWSGNVEYMTPETAVLLPYHLQPVSDPAMIYAGSNGAQWAHVDEDAAAAALRQLHDEPELRARIGNAASRHVRRVLNGDGYLQALGLSEAVTA